MILLKVSDTVTNTKKISASMYPSAVQSYYPGYDSSLQSEV